jgi:hypothetical protein
MKTYSSQSSSAKPLSSMLRTTDGNLSPHNLIDACGKKDELQTLVRHLAEFQKQSLPNERDRKRYTLVEQIPNRELGQPKN